MRGTLYCIGVGPGDPELMTLKSARLIRQADLIAVPARDSVALRIASQTVPEIAEKQILTLTMPMVRDPETLHTAHRKAAAELEQFLDLGRNIAYLTLGDPTIYCSFSYLAKILDADGYPYRYVSGVASFSAVAARLKIPLSEGDEPLHILPTSSLETISADLSGTCVIMKSGRDLAGVKSALGKSGRTVSGVTDCGMENEQLYRSLDEVPDQADYLTLLISKKA